jgi:hypothetical protein
MVSVCIPTYQGAGFIADTIDSALGQSTDDLEAVARFQDKRLHYERNPETLGVAGNWNRTVERGPRGLHQGAVRRRRPPARLPRQARSRSWSRTPTWRSSPAGATSSTSQDASSSGAGTGRPRRRGGLQRGDPTTVRAGTNIFGEPVAGLLRRDLIDKCGPFSGRRPYMIEVECWCRMLRFGPLYAHRETVGAFGDQHLAQRGARAPTEPPGSRAAPRAAGGASEAVTTTALALGMARGGQPGGGPGDELPAAAPPAGS